MFHLADLANAIPHALLLGDGGTRWEHISLDSRTIKSGELFIALKGENYDGHIFIEEAYEKGAVGAVLERSYFQKHQSTLKKLEKPLLIVDNTLLAFQLWAHHYYSLFRPFTICVTGSNGKTTTKEMIAHLLSSRYRVLKSEGNYNNEIGVPLTILKLAPEHEVLILEMAAQKTGEIKELAQIVSPDLVVVTNIGEAHIGLFGNKGNITREKAELLLALREKGTAILNRDDSCYSKLLNYVSQSNEVISFGFNPEAEIRAGDFRQKNEGELYFELIVPNKGKYRVLLPLMGKFNISNALAALATGIRMKIPLSDLIGSLANFEGADLHMQPLLLHKGITLIQDYYNANPTAAKEALLCVASIASDRFKVAVLGDMLELGEYSAGYHKEIGSLTAALCYDLLITIGDYGKFIRQGAREEEMAEQKIHHFDKQEKDRLADRLTELVPNNSIVLLKGSRSMHMEDIVQFWQANIKGKESVGHA